MKEKERIEEERLRRIWEEEERRRKAQQDWKNVEIMYDFDCSIKKRPNPKTKEHITLSEM